MPMHRTLDCAAGGEKRRPACRCRFQLLLRWLLGIVLGAALSAAAQQPPAQGLPTFAELEAAGAVIGEVRVRTANVFDLDDPRERSTLYRWANAIHIQTRASVIEGQLLFKRGDRVSAAVIDETERNLRDRRYLYDVQIRAVAYHDGVVDIEVLTRDTWSLIPGASAGRAGGETTSGLRLREYNFLGTGTTLGFGHSTGVDRSSNEVLLSNDRLFGTWTALNMRFARNSDGERDGVSLVRPFYSLDARWAAGVSAVKDNRIEPVYNAGNVAAEYRHRQTKAEAFAGLSQGRQGRWVQRYSIGVNLSEDTYALEPGRVPPTALPGDEKLVGPFLRYELIEEQYQKATNRERIAVPEFISLGWAALVQLGWADTGLGSTRDALLYAATVSRGFDPTPAQTLLASAAIEGQYTDGRVRKQLFGVDGKYYLEQSGPWLFYAAASAAVLTNPDVQDMLLLGGDNGLRGYPQRYQAGDNRVLLTLEERVYTSWFPLHLFRVGAAAFLDVGRAWGGPHVNTINPGWLTNVGAGLRFTSPRTSRSDVLHIDVAFPLNRTPDIDSVQVLVVGKATF